MKRFAIVIFSVALMLFTMVIMPSSTAFAEDETVVCADSDYWDYDAEADSHSDWYGFSIESLYTGITPTLGDEFIIRAQRTSYDSANPNPVIEIRFDASKTTGRALAQIPRPEEEYFASYQILSIEYVGKNEEIVQQGYAARNNFFVGGGDLPPGLIKLAIGTDGVQGVSNMYHGNTLIVDSDHDHEGNNISGTVTPTYIYENPSAEFETLDISEQPTFTGLVEQVFKGDESREPMPTDAIMTEMETVNSDQTANESDYVIVHYNDEKPASPVKVFLLKALSFIVLAGGCGLFIYSRYRKRKKRS